MLLRHFLRPQFWFFCLFGGAAAAINLGMGYVFYSHDHGLALPYWFSVVAAASLGIVVNFLLNYWFNFEYRGRPILAIFRTFSLVAALGIVLTTLLSLLFLALLDALVPGRAILTLSFSISKKFVAQFSAVGLVTLYSYAAHKLFSFNEGIAAGFLKIRRVLRSQPDDMMP